MAWPTKKLGELTDICRGSSPRPICDTKYFEGGTVPWVKIADATKSGKFLYETKEHVNDYGASFSRRLPPGTILVAASGTLGYTQILGVEGCAHDGWLILQNLRDLDRDFAYYALKTLEQHFFNSGSGAAIQNINTDILRQAEIPHPPLPVQRRIAGILSAYDELMENSQRRIRILEEMARALYREWFVHFRFPGHEKHPRVASPLGDIPQGWDVKLVKDILSRRAAGTVYRDEDVKPEGAIPVLDQSTNELLGFHDNEPDHLASSTMPMAIFGDHTCKMQLLIEPFSVGPNVVPFAAGGELPTAYVFFAVNSLVQTQEYKRHWIPLNAKEVIVADRVVAQRFASLIQPVLVEQATLRKAIRNLRRTRDLLLPRLLSGQVNLAVN
jgi:type I restriction enzyme S subunit